MHTDPIISAKAVKLLFTDHQDEVVTIFDRVNNGIETFLGKKDYAGYKNNVKGNLRIISAFQTTTLSYGPILILAWLFLGDKFGEISGNVFATIFVSYFGMIGALFVKEKNSLNDKWKYLASVYNDVIKITPEDHKYNKREILLTALAIDILDMEMWSHRSFRDIFRTQLETSIKETVENSRSAQYMIDHLDTEIISRSVAYAYLITYQQKLFDNE